MNGARIHLSSLRPACCPLIIGHRGASAVAPENTLAAFERALRDGADGIECDVRLARDGVPVVIHDANLRRTGLRAGRVAALSSADLAAVDVGSWFNRRYPARARAEYAGECVPTLHRVLESLRQRGAILYVEMKCTSQEAGPLAAAVVRLVRAHGLVEKAVIESFTLDALRQIKRIAPEMRTAALFERKLTRPVPSWQGIIKEAIECEANEIALHSSLVTRRIVEAARDLGLLTVVWTVDSPRWIERAASLGLHAVITNKPALMRASLTKHQTTG
jgi:glycerophosphoryl diester phosphodiesterase